MRLVGWQVLPQILIAELPRRALACRLVFWGARMSWLVFALRYAVLERASHLGMDGRYPSMVVVMGVACSRLRSAWPTIQFVSECPSFH